MFLNLRNKPITYTDWKRVAKRYGGETGVEKLEKWMNTRYLSDMDKVFSTEMTLFDIIWS